MKPTELVQSFQLLLSLDYVCLYLAEEKSLLLVDWKRQPTRSELHQGLTLVVGQLIAYKVKFWVADFSQVTYISEEEQNWYAKELLVDLHFTKLEKVARVVSGNYAAYELATNLMNLANQNALSNTKIQHQVFMNFSSALNWFGITA